MSAMLLVAAMRGLGTGLLRSGDPVRLQAHDGFYLGESGDGDIAASHREPGPETAFVLRWIGGEDREMVRSNASVALESPSGRFLAADGATGEVRAVRDRIGPAETFRIGLNE